MGGWLLSATTAAYDDSPVRRQRVFNTFLTPTVLDCSDLSPSGRKPRSELCLFSAAARSWEAWRGVESFSTFELNTSELQDADVHLISWTATPADVHQHLQSSDLRAIALLAGNPS